MQEAEARRLLEEVGKGYPRERLSHILSHSETVMREANRIAERIRQNGYDVDIDIVRSGSMLHDIGRFSCPPGTTKSIMHVVEGEKILKKMGFQREAKIAATHIGAGIPKEEAKVLGLPERDFIPETIEEKIISYADNLVFYNEEKGKYEVCGIERVRKRFVEFGPAALERLEKQHEEIQMMMKKANK